jgi:hypothetical protein
MLVFQTVIHCQTLLCDSLVISECLNPRDDESLLAQASCLLTATAMVPVRVPVVMAAIRVMWLKQVLVLLALAQALGGVGLPVDVFGQCSCQCQW